MDNNGVMTTGWQQIDGQWYYMDQAGVMQKAGLRITTMVLPASKRSHGHEHSD